MEGPPRAKRGLPTHLSEQLHFLGMLAFPLFLLQGLLPLPFPRRLVVHGGEDATGRTRVCYPLQPDSATVLRSATCAMQCVG